MTVYCCLHVNYRHWMKRGWQGKTKWQTSAQEYLASCAENYARLLLGFRLTCTGTNSDTDTVIFGLRRTTIRLPLACKLQCLHNFVASYLTTSLSFSNQPLSLLSHLTPFLHLSPPLPSNLPLSPPLPSNLPLFPPHLQDNWRLYPFLWYSHTFLPVKWTLVMVHTNNPHIPVPCDATHNIL